MAISRRSFALILALTPGIGGKSVARILARNDLLGRSPEEFFKLSAAAYKEEYRLLAKAATSLLKIREELSRIAELEQRLESLGVQLVVATAAALPAGALAAGTTGGPTTMALVSLRWLAGLAGLPVLLWLSRKTLEIPNTQSATGILYVACLAAILGELTAQLLSVAA